MSYKKIFLAMLLLAILISPGCRKNYLEIMAVTGATPLAIAEEIPSGVELSIEGMVKRNYVFSNDALKALASTRIRVEEINPEGKFLGTYAYTGIQLSNLLEGIAPSPLNKKENSKLDRLKSSLEKKLSVGTEEKSRFHPTDILVTFHNSGGHKAYFSYSELVFSDDRNPVLLAFYRKELKSNKEPEKYDKNIYRENITGLRLVCPDDSDTARYLDDVVKVTFSTLPAPDALLPPMKSYKEKKSGGKCFSGTIKCIEGNRVYGTDLEQFPVKKVDRWVRFGHGHGFQSVSSAEGISFRNFLKEYFHNISLNDFFLVAGCDGYRVILSGREIFDNPDGEFFLIIKKLDEGLPHGRLMFSAVKDFYADRDVWGVTNVVRLKIPGENILQ